MTAAAPNLPENAACLVDLGVRRDALAYRTLATLGTAAGRESVVVAVDRRRAYLACSRGNTVGVYDVDRLAGIGEVAVGREPIAAVLDEPTGRLFAADARSDTGLPGGVQCRQRCVDGPRGPAHRRAVLAGLRSGTSAGRPPDPRVRAARRAERAASAQPGRSCTPP